ncbi:hypothetical protein [Nocardioides cynanchi]|uniref:hypothetical protein n=1 Tax=Nocardioides cynanchi TaxID=2558918 RepID=UPI001244A99A|nr:hypothetical protein [Nocardioides cynanchi]
MNRRLLLPLMLLVVVVSGCASHAAAAAPPHPTPSHAACTPPPGGRCAADVAWPGPIQLSADGRRLHGVINCGGTLHAAETADTVTLTLHVGAMGPGTMSCARVDVGVRLATPLGQRTVVDAVTGHTVKVLG